MEPRVKKLYKASIKDKAFLHEIKEVDGDKKPQWYSGNNEKVIFAIMYYGWLVGRHDPDLELYI